MNKTTEQEFNDLVKMINEHTDVLHIKYGRLVAELKEDDKHLLRVWNEITEA